MDKFKLGDCDYRFMTLVWDHEPIKSGELVKLCLEELGWKKSTTYTIVKMMCEMGLLENKDTIVSAVVPKERVQREETEHFVERTLADPCPNL